MNKDQLDTAYAAYIAAINAYNTVSSDDKGEYLHRRTDELYEIAKLIRSATSLSDHAYTDGLFKLRFHFSNYYSTDLSTLYTKQIDSIAESDAKWFDVSSNSHFITFIANHFSDEGGSLLRIAKSKQNNSGKQEIFVVHGHNELIRESVARFLEHLSLKPIILHEQANRGRTILEKFIDHSDVAFSVVLLTADDVGGKPPGNKKDLLPRARQNVIFELGFFIAKLGRNNVCALYEDGVEIPTDYQGVIFIKIDPNNAWRLALAKELKESGLSVDLNKAIS